MVKTRSGGSPRADTLERQASLENVVEEENQNVVDDERVVKKKRGRPRTKEKDKGTKDEDVCPLCKELVEWDVDAVGCEECEAWIHKSCLFMTDEEYEGLIAGDSEWYCDCCLQNKANNVVWGSMVGEGDIRAELSRIYDVIITWNKNLFILPRGSSGEKFIKELTKLIYFFVNKTAWESLSLKLVHVFIPLMLQKPSESSTARNNAKYLSERLEKWKNGDLKSLMDEAQAIQFKLKQKKQKEVTSNQKGFCRLMMLGKVGQAMKLINNEDSIKV